ncbi:MAG: hypothetical protein Q7S40_33125 [Opitutaceae bacterium]|nr:hypothetical protein [Opitutaceae bacterium]
MRLVVFFCAIAAIAHAAAPEPLQAAIAAFRPDPPRGWSYTQTTIAEGKSTVEHYDATKPEFDRWSLVQKDARAPTADETKTYAEMRSRRSRGGTAPKLTDQIDVAAAELVSDAAEQLTYRCRLKPGDAGDKTAAFLRATIVVHKPTRTILTLELASTAEFSPTFGVNIATMNTLMAYTPPADERPAFPRRVATHVRGRAFWFKSLDADMSVTYTDYVKAVKK